MVTGNDAVLAPLLESDSEALRTQKIDELLHEHVFWRVDRILGARFRRSGLASHHREDVRSEIILRLMNRLHRMIADPATAPIDSFADYVAVVAFNTFDEFVRRAYPMRTRLRNRIHYALRHGNGLAVWESGGTLVCGLESWPGRPAIADPRDDPPEVHARRDDLPAMLRAVFEHYGEPLQLDALVATIARISGIRDVEGDLPLRATEVSRDDRSPLEHLEALQYLRKLWAEIGELPLPQRMALLLNARDASGESILRLLPVIAVATIRRISEMLAMEPSELAQLWHELPIEDARIAGMMGVRRQQVINLRRAARERLLRRMRPHEGPR
jgi:hypothetical protein